ncbi:MAG: hypothetical protein EPN53_14200 [Acidobacteria bacterium]|nr:MAG: hypothetical protein EPN53_14200 [Acidobacteriota bacterium]
MKHAPLVAVFFLMCALPAAAQSIAVTKPVAGTTCTKGQACAIAWTVVGQPGGTGIIELLEETTTNVVRVIKSNAQIANLQYSWTVPDDVTAGKYRVRVRVAWLTASLPGAVFTIKAQTGGSPVQPGPSAKKAVTVNAPGFQVANALLPVKILSPHGGETWEVGHQYLVKWTADTKPDDAFTVDLCNAADVKVHTLLEGGAQHNPDGSWQIMAGVACNDPEGGYKIRVTSWYAKKGATSGLVTAVIKTRKIVKNVAVHHENGLLEWASKPGGHWCEPTGKARVGYLSATFSGTFESPYTFHVLRTRLTFDLTEFKSMHGVVEKATLMFGDNENCSGLGSIGGICAGPVVVLRANDVNTWNKFAHPGINGELYPLAGWAGSPAAGGVDITVPVQRWVNGEWPNLGFVVKSPNESFACPNGATECNVNCISKFNPIMYVTFLEKPDPCGPQ